MIKSFSHKGLKELFIEGATRLVDRRWQAKAISVLDMLDMATEPKDLDKAHGFHALKGARAGSYAMSVTANWRITFRFEGADVADVNLEDYH